MCAWRGRRAWRAARLFVAHPSPGLGNATRVRQRAEMSAFRTIAQWRERVQGAIPKGRVSVCEWVCLLCAVRVVPRQTARAASNEK